MKRIDLVQQQHDVKIGDVCGDIEPNVTDDSIFYYDGEPIGFYIADLSKNFPKAAQLADIADKELRSKNVPKKWRFGNLFTSSISNYNIPASFHRDNANIEGCANVIIAKRKNSTGGHTTVPDYGATVNSADNSMLVYPAWRNVHGVTPIVPTFEGGYRNTLVFYPLKSFKGLD